MFRSQVFDDPHWIEDEYAILHRRCGIYTRPDTVDKILDLVGWRPDCDLIGSRLLEPAAGDGAFVLAAARRLLKSISKRRHKIGPRSLLSRIVSYELHPGEALKARRRITELFRENGVSPNSALKIAASWIRTGDFLLADLSQESFTHVVGNPPYIRWSSIPSGIRRQYEAKLPDRVTRGDLFLPFLDLAISCLKPDGRLGMICSDRWKYMAFAERFRAERLPEIDIEVDDVADADSAYSRSVDTYPTVLVAKRRTSRIDAIFNRPMERTTIAEAGYEVCVGPALGCTPAFVIDPKETRIEDQLLAPWIDGSEIQEGQICWRGRKVIALHDENGILRDLEQFPAAAAHMARYRDALKARAIVRKGAPWYRPIDRVSAAKWQRPKLLIPELAKFPV